MIQYLTEAGDTDLRRGIGGPDKDVEVASGDGGDIITLRPRTSNDRNLLVNLDGEERVVIVDRDRAAEVTVDNTHRSRRAGRVHRSEVRGIHGRIDAARSGIARRDKGRHTVIGKGNEESLASTNLGKGGLNGRHLLYPGLRIFVPDAAAGRTGVFFIGI